MVVKSGRASQGSAEPQLIYSPKRRKGGGGGKGWTEGWIGMPTEEEKQYILQLQRVATVDLCVFSHWTGVQWTCF